MNTETYDTESEKALRDFDRHQQALKELISVLAEMARWGSDREEFAKHVRLIQMTHDRMSAAADKSVGSLWAS